MKPSVLDILSKHQILISFTIIVLFLAGVTSFSTDYFGGTHTASIDGSCLFQDEVDSMNADLEGLRQRASNIQNEISNLQSTIVSNSEDFTNNSIRIKQIEEEIFSMDPYSDEYKEKTDELNRLKEEDAKRTDPSSTLTDKYGEYSSLVDYDIPALEQAIADATVCSGGEEAASENTNPLE